MVIWLVYSTSGITSGKKSFSRPKNRDHFENFEIFIAASFWPQIWKDRPKLCSKDIFPGDDVIDDVIGWPQIGLLYSFINVIGTIFMISKITNRDMIIGFPVLRYHIDYDYISINPYSWHHWCSWLFCWYIQPPVFLPVKKFVAT